MVPDKSLICFAYSFVESMQKPVARLSNFFWRFFYLMRLLYINKAIFKRLFNVLQFRIVQVNFICAIKKLLTFSLIYLMGNIKNLIKIFYFFSNLALSLQTAGNLCFSARLGHQDKNEHCGKLFSLRFHGKRPKPDSWDASTLGCFVAWPWRQVYHFNARYSLDSWRKWHAIWNLHAGKNCWSKFLIFVFVIICLGAAISHPIPTATKMWVGVKKGIRP